MLPESPFTRNEAFDSGLRTRQWRELVDQGLVREVVPGFYVDARVPDTVDLRLAITRRVISEDAVVARRAAAWLHGLDVLDYRGFPVTPPIEVLTKERGRRPRNSVMSAHVADDLVASDVTEVDGVRVTTPLRTVADLARFTLRPDALVTLDAFLHANLVDLGEFTSSLQRWSGRRGIRQAYEMSRLADARSESGGESRLRLRVLDMGLPRPELQIPVYDMFGVVRFYLDLGWPQWMLGLEYDGAEFHPEERADHDRSRRDWISARGWIIRAYRNTDIFTTSQAFEQEVMGLVQTSRRRWRGTLGA